MQYPALTSALLLLSLLAGCGMQVTPSNVKIKQAPAHGLTEHAFDQGYLQNLAEETRQAADQSLLQAYERNNIPARERINHARTEGHYAWLGKRQLAVVDISYSANPMRVVRIVGIEQDRLITISCISPRGEPVDLRDEDGECGRSIKQYLPASQE